MNEPKYKLFWAIAGADISCPDPRPDRDVFDVPGLSYLPRPRWLPLNGAFPIAMARRREAEQINVV
jgi:hypothetical protein